MLTDSWLDTNKLYYRLKKKSGGKITDSKTVSLVRAKTSGDWIQ